jgi:hypothetical protein
MAELSTIDLLGFWFGIFLTFCILSFLYKDNPFYKFAEHLFIGISVGYVVTKQYYDTLRPKLVDNLADGNWWYVFGLILAVMLLLKLFRRWANVGRFPIAFVVGLFAGLQINGVAQADLGKQLIKAMDSVVAVQVDVNTAPPDELGLLPGFSPLVAEEVIERRQTQPFTSLDEIAELESLSPMQREDLREARGSVSGLDARATVAEADTYWFGTFSNLLLLLGLIAGLIYFYFSIEQKGPIGQVSRFGIWVMMIGFGASFGYTVQGRISLAIGRVIDIFGDDKDPNIADQINGAVVALVSIAVIVAGLVAWEIRQRKMADAGPSETDTDDD